MKLAAQKLAYGYPGRRIGNDVTFELNAGEVLCLLGPNGSGKTTLFKTLLGLLPVQGGEVILDGRDLRTLQRDAIARLVSYVPQAHGAFFPYTVLEVVLMGRTAHLGLFAAPSASDHGAALDAIRRMGIAHLADTTYTRISGGERQLALIARALAQDAQMVVMDEPNANLDSDGEAALTECVLDLKKRKRTVVMVTHRAGLVRISDYVATMRDGAMTGVQRATEFMAQQTPAVVAGGRV